MANLHNSLVAATERPLWAARLPLWQSSTKAIFSFLRIYCHLGSYLTRAGTYGTMYKTDKNGKGGKIGTIGTS